jgi:glucose-6-phosphate 1-epimerase
VVAVIVGVSGYSLKILATVLKGNGVNSAPQLQREFGITNILSVTQKASGYPVIEIDNEYARASIALHGAHVMEFQRRGEERVLWLSRDAVYSEGKAIRGGIPICWPWFGGHPDGTLPAHGFVRNRFWRLELSEQLDNGSTRVIMSICDDDTSRSMWDYRFRLRLTIVVGNELSLSLEMENLGSSSFMVTAALHSYFNVADVSDVDVLGLEGVEYMDQLLGDKQLVQAGPVRFDGELDRIYYPARADEILRDYQLNRDILIKKTGSCSTIVWNPWVTKAESMADFEHGGHRNMVCVETGNAADDAVQLVPNEPHVLGMVISVEVN